MYRITSDRLEELAQSAAKLFPTYLKETFYSRADSKANAHGALQNCHSKLREKAIALKILNPCGNRKRKREEGTNARKHL